MFILFSAQLSIRVVVRNDATHRENIPDVRISVADSTDVSSVAQA